MGNRANITAREMLVLARSTANKLRAAAPTATRRLSLCKQLLAPNSDNRNLQELHEQLKKFEDGSRHYWIGTFYSLLLSPAERKQRAAYFTPPQLAEAIVDRVISEGFDLEKHSVIDPAAGGAAFLSTIAQKMSAAKVPLTTIKKNLRGVEINSGLARLSEALISERLNSQIYPRSIVHIGNSLSKQGLGTYDLVIANPPYGRLFQTEMQPKKWCDVCYSGHINKYALFAQLSCKLAKPDGLIALLLPSSFVAGPLYDLLRAHLRINGQLLVLGSVLSRSDVFADVSQDVSVLLLRKGSAHKSSVATVFGRFEAIGGFKATAALSLPLDPRAPWPVPAGKRELVKGGYTLQDYGASVKAGYFVWNREKDRIYNRQYSKSYVPLIWAKNIQAGSFCAPRGKWRAHVDFVHFDRDTSSIVRTDAIVLQRTTNSAQKHRLIAARLSPSILKKWGGFVTENHTIVLTAKHSKVLNDLCILLNSKAADLRYRQVSGTASVSVTLLRSLDLPHPNMLRKCLASIPNVELAIETAYANSGLASVKASA